MISVGHVEDTNFQYLLILEKFAFSDNARKLNIDDKHGFSVRDDDIIVIDYIEYGVFNKRKTHRTIYVNDAMSHNH
jgi:hypothetical protein